MALDERGMVQQNSWAYHIWLCRFGVAEIEGDLPPVDSKDGVPAQQETFSIMGQPFPILGLWWLNRIPHRGARELGDAAYKMTKLTEDEKKTSDSPPSGQDAEKTQQESGTAPGVERSANSPEDSGSQGEPHSS
jgi:hypothetical protein